jgi:hypothetical protein
MDWLDLLFENHMQVALGYSRQLQGYVSRKVAVDGDFEVCGSRLTKKAILVIGSTHILKSFLVGIAVCRIRKK